MKKKLLLFLIFFTVILLNADSSIVFEYLEYDLGEIIESKTPYQHIYNFTNNGDTDIEIENVKAG